MTPRQVQALDFIVEHITQFGTSPTIRGIAAHLSTGIGGAHALVNDLVDGGFLERQPKRARGLSIAKAPDMRLASIQAMLAELARRGHSLDALERGEPRALAKGSASCAADCCQLEVGVGELFCREHWFQLPRDLRDAIFAAWRRRDRAEYQRLVTQARDQIDAPLYRKVA